MWGKLHSRWENRVCVGLWVWMRSYLKGKIKFYIIPHRQGGRWVWGRDRNEKLENVTFAFFFLLHLLAYDSLLPINMGIKNDLQQTLIWNRATFSLSTSSPDFWARNSVGLGWVKCLTLTKYQGLGVDGLIQNGFWGLITVDTRRGTDSWTDAVPPSNRQSQKADPSAPNSKHYSRQPASHLVSFQSSTGSPWTWSFAPCTWSTLHFPEACWAGVVAPCHAPFGGLRTGEW